MDNKKWGKRFSTIFWWSLTILPLIVALIQFIGYHLTFNSGISSAVDLASYHDNSSGSFLNILLTVTGYFKPYAITYIYQMYRNLFLSIGVEQGNILFNLFAWMTSVFFYHVIFDVSVWIFRILHSWLDRWCCE